MTLRGFIGELAQSGSAPALQAGSQEFESPILHFAQMAELVDAQGLGSCRNICGGSSPLLGTKYLKKSYGRKNRSK